jgi:hypothetical protein
MSLLETQKKLCHAIASLDAHASLDDVSKALDPLLAGWCQEVDATEEDADESDGVRPLMVACDKAQEGCIEYICKANPSLGVILGHPLGESSPSKNSAMHFAAMSGCIPAIHQLSHMLGGRNGDVRKLASQRNENLDTPIMMAAVGGQVAFLRQLMQALLQQDETTDEVKKLFELENYSKYTALSLSFGYGHVEVTNFLVQEIGVTVTRDHVQECETVLKVIDGALERSACADEHIDRRKDVHRCLVNLQVHLAKTAQAAMDQLLAEEDAKEAKRKKNRKKKNKRRSKSVSTIGEGSQDNHASVPVHEKDGESDSSEEESGLSIGNQRTTKQNGNSDLPDCAATEQGVTPENKIALQHDNMSPSKSGRNATDYDLDVNAVMEALCLDNSMLLLSPHSMALNLSPSQLDAIGAVLRNQVAAVEQAREIQSRLLRKSASHLY